MNLRTRILTALLWLLLPALHALAYDNVDELPSPMDSRHVGYVCNPDGILTPAQVSILNSQLSTLNKRTTVEMAVVVVNSIGDNDPAQFAVDLGTRWGVGKSNDNGVMLLVAMQSHYIALQVGYGAEGALPDILTDRIIRGTMVPLMRKGDTYGAISGAVADVTTIVTDPAAAAELKGDAQSALKRQNAENERMLLELLSWVVGLSFIAAAGYYVVLSRQSRRLKRDWFSRSKVWRKSLWPMAILCILSAGLGLIFYLLALWRYRYWRTRRRICHRCGSKMHRLDEEKDNAYLNSAQDTEEKLGTVDYDVWLCDRCGEVESYPFVSRQNRFTACPRCGAIAYATDFERVKVPPTRQRSGVGERVKRCRHCGHTDSENFQLPRTGDDSGAGALAAGAILGSLASRGFGGGGGGGFSGGSFGGGSFGGGGSTGSW